MKNKATAITTATDQHFEVGDEIEFYDSTGRARGRHTVVAVTSRHTVTTRPSRWYRRLFHRWYLNWQAFQQEIGETYRQLRTRLDSLYK